MGSAVCDWLCMSPKSSLYVEALGYDHARIYTCYRPGLIRDSDLTVALTQSAIF